MKKKEERNYITFDELYDFYFSSWIHGFKVLGMSLQNDKDELRRLGLEVPSIGQLTTWAKQFGDNIKIYLINDLRESGLNYNEAIPYEKFRIWVYKNHHLQLHYGSKFLTCATSLVFLDEIEYVDNLGDYDIKKTQNQVLNTNQLSGFNSNQTQFLPNQPVNFPPQSQPSQFHGNNQMNQYPTFD